MDFPNLGLGVGDLILDFTLECLANNTSVKLSEHCIINRSLKVLILSEKIDYG